MRPGPVPPSPPPASTAPPFRLPGVHFIGAVLWLVLGGLGLTIVAPDLAAARFLAPRVLAVTHVYTIGVIVASVFGALYQFYPMTLGVGARSVRLGVAGAWLLHGGVAALVAGFWYWRPPLQAAGWWLLFLSIGCVSWNLLPHRRRIGHGRAVAGYVSAGHVMLGFALFIAGARIGASLGWWSLDRLGAIAAHFHLAAFGFAGLTAVGVGGRLLPMFLVSGSGPAWPMRVIGPTGSVGLLVLAGGLLLGIAPAVMVGAAIGTAAVALFAGTVAVYVRRRLVRTLEPAFGHVLAGFSALVLALGTGVWQLFAGGMSLHGWVVYGELTLLGWLVVFITGMWYRLFAFLLWLHFYGADGMGRVRPFGQVLHPGTGWTALGFFVLGVGVLVSGTAMSSVAVVRAGAGSLLMGSLLIAGQYVRLFFGRHRPSASSGVLDRAAGTATGLSG
jgi:hypothetical protein